MAYTGTSASLKVETVPYVHPYRYRCLYTGPSVQYNGGCKLHSNQAKWEDLEDNYLFKHPRQRAEATYMPVSR